MGVWLSQRPYRLRDLGPTHTNRLSPTQRAMNLSFTEKVQATVQRHGMLTSGDVVVAAVSGGPDSCAMLGVLRELRSSLRFEITVAHLDHQLRGADSVADAKFVESLAWKWGLPFSLRTEDVKALAREQKCSIETTARFARYRFLESVAREIDASAVAVAHTLEDRVETFFINLLRGAGPEGLVSMRPVRPLSGDKTPCRSELRVIRPMIECTHADAEAFLESLGVEARLDVTNFDTDCLRNRIRHRLLPLMREEFSPDLDVHLGRLFEVWQSESEHLDREVTRCIESLTLKSTGSDSPELHLNREFFLDLSFALQRRIVRRSFETVRGDCQELSFQHIENLLNWLHTGKQRGKWSLPAGVEVECQPERITMGLSASRSGVASTERPEAVEVVPLVVPGTTRASALSTTIEARVFRRERHLAIPDDPFVAWIDYSEKLVLGLRSPRPGDRFRPLGCAGQQKLQDFFVNAKVPRPRRHRIPLVGTGDAIVWVVGHRLDDRFKVTDSTNTVLELKSV